VSEDIDEVEILQKERPVGADSLGSLGVHHLGRLAHAYLSMSLRLTGQPFEVV
jgi:hypothetical protein